MVGAGIRTPVALRSLSLDDLLNGCRLGYGLLGGGDVLVAFLLTQEPPQCKIAHVGIGLFKQPIYGVVVRKRFPVAHHLTPFEKPRPFLKNSTNSFHV